MTTLATTDASFDTDVLQATHPVLVDFWAEWCGPCKQLGPAIEAIATELAGTLSVVKMNIDDSPTTPARYGVRGIPTIMLFREGRMVDMKIGNMPKSKILDWLADMGVTASAA